MASTTPIPVLRKRAEFLAVAARDKKWVTAGLLLQQGPPREGADPIRYGLTASKKVGNAVKRNRARRRLRVLAQSIVARHAREGFDYVLIARPATVTRGFSELQADIVTALKKLGAYRD